MSVNRHFILFIKCLTVFYVKHLIQFFIHFIILNSMKSKQMEKKDPSQYRKYPYHLCYQNEQSLRIPYHPKLFPNYFWPTNTFDHFPHRNQQLKLRDLEWYHMKPNLKFHQNRIGNNEYLPQ